MFSPEVENYFYVNGAIDVHGIINGYVELIEDNMFNLKTTRDTVLTMLGNRHYLSCNGTELPLIDPKIAQYEHRRKHTYTLVTNNGERYAVRFYCHDLISMSYGSLINNFVSKYKKYHRIIIAPSYDKDIQSYALETSTTIFSMTELCDDILKIPKIKVFTNIKNNLRDINYCNTATVPSTHIIPKYYGLDPGNIFKILSDATIGTGKTTVAINVAEMFKSKTNNGCVIVV